MFSAWLAANRPDVRLLPWQQAWVEAHDRGERAVVVGGRLVGRTFVERLFREYTEARP